MENILELQQVSQTFAKSNIKQNRGTDAITQCREMLTN